MVAGKVDKMAVVGAGDDGGLGGVDWGSVVVDGRPWLGQEANDGSAVERIKKVREDDMWVPPNWFLTDHKR